MSDQELAIALRPRLVAAIDGLAAIRSTDPAATTALHAVRLAETTLIDRLLPAVDAVLGREQPEAGQ